MKSVTVFNPRPRREYLCVTAAVIFKNAFIIYAPPRPAGVLACPFDFFDHTHPRILHFISIRGVYSSARIMNSTNSTFAQSVISWFLHLNARLFKFALLRVWIALKLLMPQNNNNSLIVFLFFFISRHTIHVFKSGWNDACLWKLIKSCNMWIWGVARI